MPLLQVRNLTITFGNNQSLPAVDNISFSIDHGETLGVVGESGSGKTLTGLAIIGLIPEAAKVTGEIILNNNSESINLNLLSAKRRRKYRGRIISMIFQDPMISLNPSLQCGRQVDEILKIHSNLSARQRRKKVLELFEEVMLPNPSQIYIKYPHQLSGGQLKRVMIAMAVACNPLILIADEPTTALDVTVQKSIVNLLFKLKDKYKISVIFITHDLAVVSKIADKLMVMRKGKQIEYGTAEQILREPKNQYTKGLLECRPSTNVRLERLPLVENFLMNDYSKLNLKYVTSEEREKSHRKIYAQKPILTITKLNTYFIQNYNFFGKSGNSFHAIRNADIQIWQGETLGLVGESGCGKTTLGKTLMHLIEKFDGSILYKNKDVSKLKGKDLLNFRKSVQLIFQDTYSSLNPNHTIGYAIKEPMIVHGLYKKESIRNEKVLELMQMTGLDEYLFHRYPFQLSGGQRQRVVISRALALQPEVLICDESVSSLDVSIQANILNLLNDLKKQLGLTYLFISHDLAVVKYMSDRIIVMKEGQIIENGEADALFENPQEEYTKVLIDAVNTNNL